MLCDASSYDQPNSRSNPIIFFSVFCSQEQRTEYDFKGGAGGTCERKQSVKKPGVEYVECPSPKADLVDDLSDSQNELKDPTEATPTRHSARTARKSYK